eukprot:gene9958-11008_t
MTKKDSERKAAEHEIMKKRHGGLDAALSSSEDESEEEENDEGDDGDDNNFIVDDEDDEEEEYQQAPPSPPRPSRSSSKRASSSDTGRRMKCFNDMVKGGHSDDERDNAYGDDSMDDFIVNGEEEEEEDDEDAQIEGESLDDDSEGKAPRIRRDNSKNKKEKTKKSSKKKESKKEKKVSKKVKKEKSKKSRKKRKKDDDDDEDDEEDGENEDEPSKKKKKRRASRTLFLSDDEEDDDEEEEEEEGSSGDGGSDSEEEREGGGDMDGPALYWQVNAMLDQQYNNSDDEEAFFAKNRLLSMEEAFATYIEMLARVLINATLRQDILQEASPAFQKYYQASKTIENVICTHRESLLGSSAWQREYLQSLQSRPFFVAQSFAHCITCSEERCEACGRIAQRPDHLVRMYGPSYDGNRIWSARMWVKAIPEFLFLESYQDAPDEGVHSNDVSTISHHTKDRYKRRNKQFKAFEKKKHLLLPEERDFGVEVVNDEDDDDDSNKTDNDSHEDKEVEEEEALLPQEVENETMIDLSESDGEIDNKWWLRKLPQRLNYGETEVKFNLAAHCKNRSQLYHTLLHYKFRLLLKVREVLERNGPSKGGSSKEWNKVVMMLSSDHSFVQQELKRLQSLLKSATRQYGGQRYEILDIVQSVWSDDEGIGGHRSTAKTSVSKKSNGEESMEKEGKGSSTKSSKRSSSYKRQASMLQFVKKTPV